MMFSMLEVSNSPLCEKAEEQPKTVCLTLYNMEKWVFLVLKRGLLVKTWGVCPT